MSKLLDYINHLDKDANARAAHKANPVKSMTDFGLTIDEQDALLSGDKQRVADVIGIAADEVPVLTAIATPF
jgi:hypothetical protein